MTAAIHTERLTRHYGPLAALVDLDLDVGQGEGFGFLGPHGAGKTTVIRTLMDETLCPHLTGRDLSSGNRQRVGVLEQAVAMVVNACLG